jgi:hypothetical protein
MKFNWGTGIFLFLIIFVLAMATFVTFAFNQDVNLVNKEYYQKGVKFDDEREQKQRAEKVKDKIELIQTEETISVLFDEQYFSKVKQAQAHFYRPSDRHKDLKIAFDSNKLDVPKSEFLHGRYTLILSWEYQNELYLFEKYVFIK